MVGVAWFGYEKHTMEVTKMKDAHTYLAVQLGSRRFIARKNAQKTSSRHPDYKAADADLAIWVNSDDEHAGERE